MNENYEGLITELGKHKISNSVIGNKGYYLNELLLKNYNVPRSYAICANVFWKVVEYNNLMSNIVELLEGEDDFLWDSLSKTIISMKFPDELLQVLMRVTSIIGYPVAVRSSAIDEDSFGGSRAGIYDSFIQNENIYDITKAIKECWASAFSPISRKFGAYKGPMPLVIQKSILVGKFGVAYGMDPSNNNEQIVTICTTNDSYDGITSGKMAGDINKINKNEAFGVTQYYSEKLEVAKLLVEIENKVLGRPGDMEWVINNNKIYILQVRPIAFVNEKLSQIYYDLDETDNLEKLYIENFEEIHGRWIKYKSQARKVAISYGFKVPKAYYFTLNHKSMNRNNILCFINLISTQLVTVDISDSIRSILVRKNELYDFIILEASKCSGEKIIRIRELLEYKMSGHARKLIDGNYIIESFPGTFNTIIQMNKVPGYYITNGIGEVINKKIYQYNLCGTIDCNKLKFVESEGVYSSELTNHMLFEIANMVEKMSNVFEKICLEWTYHDDLLYFCDNSFEENELPITKDSLDVISEGNFEGTVRILHDLSLLSSACSLHTVSVIPEKKFDISKTSKEVEKFKYKYLRKDSKKIIVIAKKPVLELAFIVDEVDGFIFEEGSILCHLSIILRERKIPAIFVKDAMEIYKRCKEIHFVDGLLY